MWTSFHHMYNRFIDPTKRPKDAKGADIPIGAKTRAYYADSTVMAYWRAFRDMLNYKIKDIAIQRQDLADTYAKGVETSWGDSNTDPILQKEYGILVKRQDGSQITATDIEEIRKGWLSVQNVFGNLKPNAEKYNLKISHASKRMMFASKAIGMWVPRFKTIGVSSKFGMEQFNSTFSHEVGHFIDYLVGQLTGKRYETDDYESKAGIIAFTFRNHMNKDKSEQSDYINCTKECFARSMQMYYGVETLGEDAGVSYDYEKMDEKMPFFTADNFVPKEVYYDKIKPMIEEFLAEQFDVFKTTVDLDGSDDIVPIGTENIEPVTKIKRTEEIEEPAPEIKKPDPVPEPVKEDVEDNEISELIKSLQTLRVMTMGDEKQEITDLINALEYLK